jgi:hypothetical protein
VTSRRLTARLLSQVRRSSASGPVLPGDIATDGRSHGTLWSGSRSDW